jgi:hypothetical protein
MTMQSIAQDLEADGIVLLKDFFAKDVCQHWTDEYYAIKSEIGRGGSSLSRDSRFVYGEIPPPVGNICLRPELKELMSSLIGPDVALYMNRFMLKDENWSGAVSVHIDEPYFHGGASKVSVFVPLTPQDAADGNLYFYKKSHRYGNLGRGTILVDQFASLEKFQPDLTVGDIVLMNFCTWHGSDDPTRKTNRGHLQLVYQPASDGSYNLVAPTLVTGSWRTEFFCKLGSGVTPDV